MRRGDHDSSTTTCFGSTHRFRALVETLLLPSYFFYLQEAHIMYAEDQVLPLLFCVNRDIDNVQLILLAREGKNKREKPVCCRALGHTSWSLVPEYQLTRQPANTTGRSRETNEP